MTDIKQLIEWLRKEGEWVLPGLWKPNQLCKEAADALERRTQEDSAELDLAHKTIVRQGDEIARLTQPVGVEPVGYFFQHEETGLTTCVDVQQVEWGFEKNNPRHINCGPVFSAETVARLQAEKAQLQAERDELIEVTKGARVVFDRLRTSKETQFSHVQARDGAMVHVHSTIASIDAALAKIEGSKS